MAVGVGDTIRTDNLKTTALLKQVLGSGGQAKVFLASLSGQDVAMKLFFPEWHGDALWQQLQFVVECGSPGPWFAWPFDLVREHGELGVVMPVIPRGFVSVEDLLTDQVKPSMRVLVKACYEIAHAFLELHAKGICYKDINRANIFFSPTTGSISIVDNENVAYNRTPSLSLGTVGYMAPELGRGESPCTIDTDRHSLGVLLFELLHVAHPFSGKKEREIPCLTADDVHRLYCREPLFIFHPTDTSNRPDPATQQNAIVYWAIYPKFLRDLFIRHFTIGLTETQDQRVREVEWRRALVRLQDAIFLCSRCGVELFRDADSQAGLACWNCHSSVSSPSYFQFKEGNDVVFTAGTVLYPHHVEKRPFDFAAPVAQVVGDFNQGGAGLKNLSRSAWVVKRTDGSLVTAPPGSTVRLVPGTQIKFVGNTLRVCG